MRNMVSRPSLALTRRELIAAARLTGVATVAGLWRGGVAFATDGPSSYTPTWSSVDQHPPAPEWFQDAKFGIYFHRGVFSVPAFANEWYPRNMYFAGSNENNHHRSVYAEPSAWPYHNFINGARNRAGNWVQFAPGLTTLSANRINLSTLVSAQLLGSTAGSYIELSGRTQDGAGLRITLPTNAPYSAPAYVVKLAFSGPIPTLDGGSTSTGWVRITNVTTGLVLDSGGNVASGSVLKQWNYDGSTNLQWQLVDVGGGYYRLVNRTNGMVADSGGNTANGASAIQAPWNGGDNQQWRLSGIGDNRYQIVNRGTGTVLDSGGDSTVGSRVKLWAPDPSTNLQWTITAIDPVRRRGPAR